MTRKIEMEVTMHCEKCKTQVLKAISILGGIDQMTVDVENQRLTVIGDVDPVVLTRRVRRIGKFAKIIRVGPFDTPNPIPPPATTLTPGPAPTAISEAAAIAEPPRQLPPCCRECQLVTVIHTDSDVGCLIL